MIYRAVDEGPKSGLPPVGKVDLTKNACIVSSKTDEVFDDGTTHFSAKARGVTLGEDLIRHGFAVPPSPPGEGFWLPQRPDKSEFAPKLSGAGVSPGVGVDVGCDAPL